MFKYRSSTGLSWWVSGQRHLPPRLMAWVWSLCSLCSGMREPPPHTCHSAHACTTYKIKNAWGKLIFKISGTNIHFFEISKPLDRMKLALGLGTKELGSDHYIPNQRAPQTLFWSSGHSPSYLILVKDMQASVFETPSRVPERGLNPLFSFKHLFFLTWVL